MKSLSKRVGFSLMAIGVLAGTTPSQAMLIYSNDFDNPAFVATGVTATLSGGFLGSVSGGPYAGSNGKTWAGNYLNGGLGFATVTLTLSNLPAHTGVSIDMLLGFLNSWDSRNGTITPDNLNVYIDGSQIMSMTTNNASGTIVDFDGGTLLVDNGQIDSTLFFSDDLVDMATASLLTFSHTASTLTLKIEASGAGWQGWTDEGWGMDALSVGLSGTGGGGSIPEPATLALLGLGLAGLGIMRRQ